MDRNMYLPVALLGALVAGACGGEGEAAMEDMGDMAEAAVATMDAPAGLEGCFINGSPAETQERPSPLKTVSFEYANGEAVLCYGAPSANSREIFGGLQQFGSPWRAGANEATAIHLSGAASIGGVAVEAGSYSLYAVPGEEEWEFFVNSNAERWGIPINDEVTATNVGSFTATPEPTDGMVETLTYSFVPTDEGMGDIVMEWENTRVKFHIHPGAM